MSQNEGAFRHRGYNSVDDLLRHKAMDGKEEVRVVEEQPAWQAGSLESLDVIDKVPDESVKLAADQ